MNNLVSPIDEELANHIIDNIYPQMVQPLSCVMRGARTFGLGILSSPYDFVGIHLTNSWDCLEHPNYRPDIQIVEKWSENTPDQISWSLKSYEMWKFIDLIVKGSIVTFEILYLPEIHHAEGIDQLISLCRACLNNRIGPNAQHGVSELWRKNKTNREITLACYYYLAQALYLLKEEEFEWQAEQLFDYIKTTTNLAGTILETYKDPLVRNTDIPDDAIPTISHEIVHLMNEIDKAMVETTLPNETPKEILQNLLEVLRNMRARQI